jgi:hypothetical protein
VVNFPGGLRFGVTNLRRCVWCGKFWRWSANRFTDDCFPGTRGGVYEGRHMLSEVCSVQDCTETVPREHLITGLGNSEARKGLM